MPRPLRALIALAALGLVAMLPAVASAAPGKRPALAAGDGDELIPGFEWGVANYGARCGGDGLTLDVDGVRGWKVAVGGGGPRGGDFAEHAAIVAGEDVRVRFVRRDGETRRAYVRCLPEDMVDFDFKRVRSGGPRLFVIQVPPNYAVAMSRAGAPVWWLASDDLPFDAQILPSGKVGWNAGGQGGVVDFGVFEYRTLTGRIVRTVASSSGDYLDIHDHLTLPNGNELVGVPTYDEGVDLSAYGGPADAGVRNTTIEELTPAGKLVRSWDSGRHIGLGQTPDRWWQTLLPANPDDYDVSHWNGVEVVGRYMYLSFRHLDAIYKVDRRTGKIVWKLGGTETGKSLEVRGDPRRDEPLVGQHDVRVLGDGTVTVFDNSTFSDRVPRAVRYRIHERRGVARMTEEVIDPKVEVSGAGGSARRAGYGWLVNWGVSNPGVVAAYNERGKPIFRITYPRGATYRANPAPRSITFAELRRAMDRMSP